MSKGKNVHIAFVCAQYPSGCYLLTIIVVFEYYSDFDGRQTHVDDGRKTLEIYSIIFQPLPSEVILNSLSCSRRKKEC